MKKKNSDQENYELQARICKALANPVRLHLIEMLGKKERWASELQEGLGISKANLSQHLSVLRAAGVVSTQRDGKQIYCGIALPQIKQASLLLKTLTKEAARSGRRAMA